MASPVVVQPIWAIVWPELPSFTLAQRGSVCLKLTTESFTAGYVVSPENYFKYWLLTKPVRVP